MESFIRVYDANVITEDGCLYIVGTYTNAEDAAQAAAGVEFSFVEVIYAK